MGAWGTFGIACQDRAASPVPPLPAMVTAPLLQIRSNSAAAALSVQRSRWITLVTREADSVPHTPQLSAIIMSRHSSRRHASSVASRTNPAPSDPTRHAASSVNALAAVHTRPPPSSSSNGLLTFLSFLSGYWWLVLCCCFLVAWMCGLGSPASLGHEAAGAMRRGLQRFSEKLEATTG